MNNGTVHVIILIAVMSVATILLRALPFLVFKDEDHTPAIITYLGDVLPFAMIGMLVVYCLKDVEITSKPFGLLEGIAALSVIFLQKWKRNSLISILAGTVIYMLLLRIGG